MKAEVRGAETAVASWGRVAKRPVEARWVRRIVDVPLAKGGAILVEVEESADSPVVRGRGREAGER